MRTFIATMAFFGTYCCLYACVAAFFAMVTTATFQEICGHPAYMVLPSFVYLFVAGTVADEVYDTYGQVKDR